MGGCSKCAAEARVPQCAQHNPNPFRPGTCKDCGHLAAAHEGAALTDSADVSACSGGAVRLF
jgi:hypothetical protein